jgi:hypothetical protein
LALYFSEIASAVYENINLREKNENVSEQFTQTFAIEIPNIFKSLKH